MSETAFGAAPGPGAQLGGWTLSEPLGSGGIAAVFRATHVDGRQAALKVLHPASVGTDEVRRFQREYRALARLKHPNIVQVHEAGVADGYPWIAMELVAGQDLDATLRAWAEDEPADRWDRVTRIVSGLCRALAYIHDLGLVHRDLKPSNVLLDEAGEPRLGDFGGVKDRHAQTTALTRHGDLIGTVAFMAPEQILDEPVDARTDLYALGAVLYVMLTDRRPIEAESVTGFLARHIAHVPPAPSSVRPDVPAHLEALCQRLLYKDKNHRYPSAKAVLRALERGEEPERAPLRGRDTLVGAWHERLAELREGRGRVISLTGPMWSGTGFALQSLLHDLDLRVLRASGIERNAIRTLLHAADPDCTSPTAGQLRKLADAVRGRPTVMAVTDLDQADPRIIDALSRLCRKLIVEENQPLMLIFTAKHPPSEALSPLHDLGPLITTRWRLGPISRRAIAQILKDRGLTGGTAGVLSRRMHAELLGRPAAVVAQLGALVREGWLGLDGDRLVPRRRPHACASDPLPVPDGPGDALRRILDRLDPDALGAVEVLALMGRPSSIPRVRSLADVPSSTVEALIADGLWDFDEDSGALSAAVPWLNDVAEAGMSEARVREVHRAIAESLGQSRRRNQAAEVAQHYEAAGMVDRAWPLYLRAARSAAQDRQHNRVLDACRAARRAEEAGISAMDEDSGLRLQWWGRQLEGEAWLARGEWQRAIAPLAHAARIARARKDDPTLARSLGSQGRAWYRLGRFDEATPCLEGALQYHRPGEPDRASALRGLADIRLREGDLTASEELWSEAVSMARAADARDAEARACRGLAHLRTLEGRLHAASELLDQAEDLIRGTGDPRVCASILARSLELDLAAGRYARALHRSDSLLELVERRDLEERVLEALGLRAECCLVLGREQDARDLLAQVEARLPGATWPARLRAARHRAWLGPSGDALQHLPGLEEVPDDPIEDAAGQASAVRALCLAEDRAEDAVDLARWCQRRPRARLILRPVRIHLDAGEALLRAGQSRAAREAVKAGLRHVSGAGGDGLRLELLALFHEADPDPRIRAAFRQVVERVLDGQPAEIRKALSQRETLRPAFENVG